MENLEKRLAEYREQFGCHCGCLGNRMRDEVVMKLMFAEGTSGIKFEYTSGYRCPQHNADVGGVADSAHIYGEAVDIFYRTETVCLRVVRALLAAGFERIEVYSLEEAIAAGAGGAKIHVDMHHKRVMPWFHIGRKKYAKS